MYITGIGWAGNQEHGALHTGHRERHADWRDLYRMLRDRGIIPDSLRDFGRFDPDTKRVCLVAALALSDAGIVPGSPESLETGLLIAGMAGAREANLAYFRDYVTSGRTLGRGNLFIYTLPTSPGAETAISFGLRGPLLYLADTDGEAGSLRAAADFVSSKQAQTMLCVLSCSGITACYALREFSNGTDLPLSAAFQTPENLAPPEHLRA